MGFGIGITELLPAQAPGFTGLLVKRLGLSRSVAMAMASRMKDAWSRSAWLSIVKAGGLMVCAKSSHACMMGSLCWVIKADSRMGIQVKQTTVRGWRGGRLPKTGQLDGPLILRI